MRVARGVAQGIHEMASVHPASPSSRSAAQRIPPIQCLLTFEALARLRSVTQTADELCVTPSARSRSSTTRI